MNRTELLIAMKDCYETRNPLVVIGKPGIGKTDLVEQFANSIGVKMHPFNAASFDPSSFGITIPRVDNSACDIVPTAEFVDPLEKDIVFFDEMDKLDPLIQNVMLPLIQNHRIHGKKLNKYWYVVAGNGTEHGGSHEISSLIRGRAVFVEYDGPTVKEWIEYAQQCGIDYRVCAFLERNPKFLNAFDKKETASPTQRQWFKVSSLINSGVFGLLLPGIIGRKAAAEFQVFIELTMRIPDWPVLLATAGTYQVPQDYVLRSILSYMIGEKLDGINGDTLKPVMNQLEAEFIIMILSRAAKRQAPKISEFILRNNYISMMHAAIS